MRRTAIVVFGLLTLSLVLPVNTEAGRRSRRRCCVPYAGECCAPQPTCCAPQPTCCAAPPTGSTPGVAGGPWFCKAFEMFPGVYVGSRHSADHCLAPVFSTCSGGNCGPVSACFPKPSGTCQFLRVYTSGNNGHFHHAAANHWVSLNTKLNEPVQNSMVDHMLGLFDPLGLVAVFDGYLELPDQSLKLRLIQYRLKGFTVPSFFAVEVTGEVPQNSNTVRLVPGEVTMENVPDEGFEAIRVVTYTGAPRTGLQTGDAFVAITTKAP